MSTFNRGDDVYIKRLKKFASVLEEARPGLYRVLIGTFTVECPEGDLEKVTVKRKPGSKNSGTSLHSSPPTDRESLRRAGSVDLHGLTVEEAIRRVESAIDRAILSGLDQLSIVHGLGTGKVREAVHRLLPELRVVQRFKLDDVNPGITIVYF